MYKDGVLLITRVITAIIGIALAAVVIQTGGWVFAAAIALLSVIGWFEYVRMFRQHGERAAFIPGVVILILFLGIALLGNSSEFMAVCILGALVIMSGSVIFRGSFSIIDASITLAGVIYIGGSFSYLLMLRFIESGQQVTPLGMMSTGNALVWIALIGTWASDTFAYFAGSTLGAHKLCPSVSPNKTWEGFAGGLVGTIISVMLVGGYFFGYGLPEMALLGLCIALVATLGDLVESVIKRYTGIKDSGNIIPGHGGVLDRFDSVMFSVPFVYYASFISGIWG